MQKVGAVTQIRLGEWVGGGDTIGAGAGVGEPRTGIINTYMIMYIHIRSHRHRHKQIHTLLHVCQVCVYIYVCVYMYACL